MAPLAQKEESYSYADLLAWEDDPSRYELYDGQPVALASPTDIHQSILGELFLQLGTYLRGKRCKAYLSPFDVRLFEERSDSPQSVKTVLQPDLSVVCDPEKVDRHGIHGAPDMVIEILSPTTARSDRIVKYDLYQQAGVREYWIVDPETRTVSVHTLEDGAYYSAVVYTAGMSVPVGILEDCTIDLSQVFQTA